MSTPRGRALVALALAAGCSDSELTEACLKDFPVTSADQCLSGDAAEPLLAQDPDVNNECKKLEGVEGGPAFDPPTQSCCYVVELSPRDCGR